MTREMAASHEDPSAVRTRRSPLMLGTIAGLVAGAMMAIYAMIASAIGFGGAGFFTPLYGIAAPVVGVGEMERSMQAGIFHFAPLPAFVGLMGHMMWSAIYGAIFGAIAAAVRLTGVAAVAIGGLYGIAVMVVMSFVALPLFGLATMPQMVGTPSWTIEHLIFGMALGAWPALRPGDLGAAR